MKRTLAPLAGLLALGLAMAAPVQAAPLEWEHYSGTDSFDFDDCGFVIHEDVTFSGLFMLKAPKDSDAPPRLFNNYESHETLTANGKTMTIDHQGLYKDLRITRVEGTVFRFVSIENGRPFVVRDGDGNILYHDRGSLRTAFVVDTQGDQDLDNDVFLDGSFELIKDAGRHPGFYVDFCEIMADYFLD